MEAGEREGEAHQLGPLQCQYRGTCYNERAVKTSGDRHWLCDFHRKRQNDMQRARYQRLVERRKQEMRDFDGQELSGIKVTKKKRKSKHAQGGKQGTSANKYRKSGEHEQSMETRTVQTSDGNDPRQSHIHDAGTDSQKHSATTATAREKTQENPPGMERAGSSTHNSSSLPEHEPSQCIQPAYTAVSQVLILVHTVPTAASTEGAQQVISSSSGNAS